MRLLNLDADLIAGGGLNLSLPANQLEFSQARTVHNLLPTPDGFSNETIGFSAQINQESTPVAPIQCGFVFGGQHCFVRQGCLYGVSLRGGVPSLKATNIFDPDARVRVAFNRGGGTQKAYLVDGISELKSWDGISIQQIPLPDGFGAPDKLISWRQRIVLGFGDNQLLFSQVEDGDSFLQTIGSLVDPFSERVGDGDPIQALGTVKVKNADRQSELLLAIKDRQTYQADELVLGSQTVVEATFNRIALDVGAVNADTVVNFGNDIYMLHAQGVGALGSATDSGGVNALTFGNSEQVNPLIRQASRANEFSRSLAIHVPGRQMIVFFLPNGSGDTPAASGRVPLSLAIAFHYGYGLDPRSGRALSAWTTLGGPGFRVAAAWTDGQELYVGTESGNLFRMFAGDTFEDGQAIRSIFETGDWQFGDGSLVKSIKRLRANFRILRKLRLDARLALNGEADPSLTYAARTTDGSELSGLTYGGGNYGQGTYGGWFPARVTIKPAGRGTAFRLRVTWDSRLPDGVSNHGILSSFSGLVELGSVRR
jgi:hypothetical protein